MNNRLIPLSLSNQPIFCFNVHWIMTDVINNISSGHTKGFGIKAEKT